MRSCDDSILSPDPDTTKPPGHRKWFGMVTTGDHVKELEASGLTRECWDAHGLGTVGDMKEAKDLLNWNNPPHKSMGPFLAFPYFNLDGEPINYVRLKPAVPVTDKKNGKARKYEAPKGMPNRAYFPAAVRTVARTPDRPLIITEGEKKALCAGLHGFPTIGLGGVWNWKIKRENAMLPDLAGINWTGRRVYICFDSDREDNANVQHAERALAAVLARYGADVRVVALPPGPNGAKTGIDDFFVRGGTNEQFQGLLDAAQPPAVTYRSTKRDDRVQILVDPDVVEAEVTEQVIDAMAAAPNLYRRGESLAGVGVIKKVASVYVHEPATIRGVISRLVKFLKTKQTAEGPIEIATQPPDWCVNAVAKDKLFHGVRSLDMIVNQPVLRQDGSVLTTPGYDPVSELYLHWDGEPLALPANPTQADARRAAAELLELVSDFPFDQDCHRAAWLAALLTPLCRPAFNGPSPLFLVDANLRSAGKGKLLGVVAYILTGERFPNVGYPLNNRGKPDEAEFEKRVTTQFLNGVQASLFDNLTGDFGDGVLDDLLTATRWDRRILGINKPVKAPATITWYATGNNVRVVGDTPRRTCRIRLESPLENPENRGDFKIIDIEDHAKRHRNKYLAAALIIAKAFHAAGCPDMKLRPWGSFEGWSALVRNAVAWCGLPDPGDARLTEDETADEAAVALRNLFEAMDYFDAPRRGMTAAEMVAAATDTYTHPQDKKELMESAILVLAGALDARKFGNAIRSHRRRAIGGRVIDEGKMLNGKNRWVVRDVAEAFKTAPKAEPTPAPSQEKPLHPAQKNDGQTLVKVDVVDVVDVFHGGATRPAHDGKGQSKPPANTPPAHKKTAARINGKRLPTTVGNP